VKNSSAKSIFGLEKDGCPRGTVPIRRTTKDNLIQSKLLSNDHILNQEVPGLYVSFSFYNKIEDVVKLLL